MFSVLLGNTEAELCRRQGQRPAGIAAPHFGKVHAHSFRRYETVPRATTTKPPSPRSRPTPDACLFTATRRNKQK